MKLNLTVFALLILCFQPLLAQHTFKDDEGNKHLCGKFEIADLQNDTTFSQWYVDNYEAYEPALKETSWKKNLKDVTVDIYMGTWCGDSRMWVPRFVKLWDELGLKRSQLSFTALYNSDIEGKYKQGPNSEEKGLFIHRVPDFIFKRDGKEIARIVESPVNDLETDLAQIALGYPSKPNYRAAAYMMDLLDKQPLDSINAHMREHFFEVYHRTGKSAELNTLGYVYMAAGELEKAALVLQFNTYLFRYMPNVYDSYAEVMAKMGKTDTAIQYYKKVLELDPENEKAKQKVEELQPTTNKSQE